MILVIKHGRVIATDTDRHQAMRKYPDAEITDWDGPAKSLSNNEGNPWLDPRSREQRDQDRKMLHQRKREQKYPGFNQLIRLLYLDRKNGTNKFVEAIDAIHAEFPPDE